MPSLYNIVFSSSGYLLMLEKNHTISQKKCLIWLSIYIVGFTTVETLIGAMRLVTGKVKLVTSTNTSDRRIKKPVTSRKVKCVSDMHL
jgi:hypothetical protein